MLRFVFALSIILCAYMFYHWVTINDDEPLDEYMESVPTYVATNMKATTYNRFGQPYRELAATEIQYYDYLSTGYLVNPHMTYFPELDPKRTANAAIDGTKLNQGSLEKWTITSEYGIANVNDNLNLRGNVVGHATKLDAVVTDISARYLEYDLNTQDIRTNEQITLSGQQLINTCNQVTGNLETQQYLLEDNCHATYDVPKKSSM